MLLKFAACVCLVIAVLALVWRLVMLVFSLISIVKAVV
jgi:hypothetical protein